MKNFRLNFIDENGEYAEIIRKHASDVVLVIKGRGIETFEIEWLTPITKEYTSIITVGASKIIINNRYELPKVFKEILF